ncbi:Carbamoyl-phosphate synthase small chain [uncultured spirochete]|uniref:Carbamoyl phosphate synthase small chain n=1 Tax=uncultured spirochete TaxID=156406 RepID=A0A3P3XMX1_9SPIR|nr:Carbamoyl-phosphate synthase small chain [uncultured spirochete]
MSRKNKSARLVLEDGSVFEGLSIGAEVSVEGEVVFSTGMVGYNQSLTDPSYCGQILVFAYPLIGNYGVPALHTNAQGVPLNFESKNIQVSGVIVSEASMEPSHYTAKQSFSEWLTVGQVPGISGIDTRKLIRLLRENGVMKGRILVDGSEEPVRDELKAHAPVKLVSPKDVVRYKGHPDAPKIALIDCGVKANILRILLNAGAEVIRLPWDYPLESIEYDGLFLSNGPGDPKACTKTIAHLRHALSKPHPIFGICLGTQLMALAAGADTFKLKYGHRGQNQPAIETESGRCYITSQNHGYAVHEDSLPPGWEPWFLNGNDGTVEGIRAAGAPFKAVQFHPEGCPGPRDTQFLIDEFLQEARAAKDSI